jgi:uncharacterized spore protein YtfJ
MTTGPQEAAKTTVLETAKSILDRLQGTATVKTVFGEPIETKDKILIPVAKVAYGFGTVAGSGKGVEVNDERGGSAAGGGVCAGPAGVLEITKEGTKFIPIRNRKPLLLLLLGVGIGMSMACCCRSRNRRSE